MNPDSESKETVHPLRGRLRKQLRAATQGAILDAAEAVLAAEGLHRAGMNAIAARAGVSVGTLYNHFRHRDELVAALFESRRAALLSGVDDALAAVARAPFAAQLRALVAGQLGFFVARRAFVKLALDSEAPPPAAGRLHVMQQLALRTGKVVQRGISQRALAPDPHGLLPGALQGLLKAAMLRMLAGDLALPAAVDATIALFLHGAARKGRTR
ncbi:MAG: TetR/AcrR family transcriptional regulator [Deltaproteobacteria bacterium]|nr:TetR/AcrR family transcriptional regulator [Deltaproteobacteria bacterium]